MTTIYLLLLSGISIGFTAGLIYAHTVRKKVKVQI